MKKQAIKKKVIKPPEVKEKAPTNKEMLSNSLIELITDIRYKDILKDIQVKDNNGISAIQSIINQLK